MIIKPNIRFNYFTNAHPLGCRENVLNQINRVKELGSFDCPKNVLIIGGSSGYGLASRIALAYGGKANTVNVSYESEPRGKRTGSAGYWNNVFFNHFSKETGQIHKDFMGDAFSQDMKTQVSNYIKEHFGTIDLIIYSLAAGARKNEQTGEVVRSQIKSIGQRVVGKTIDVASLSVQESIVEPATQAEIEDTVFVMGGGDWQDWLKHLDREEILSHHVKTIAYTYVGGPNTEAIYRKGTMGKAKEDLEAKALDMNQWLGEKYQGEALISSSKAVVSKASVFIPQMAVYMSCLLEVMRKHQVHESIIEHKYRLFKDMVYGDKRITDDQGRIRLDHLEMDDKIQKETLDLMKRRSDQAILESAGAKEFLQSFYEINGFQVQGIDYDDDVDTDKLLERYLPNGF
jgi:enoyl-[acyl-carrier protein] reductase/trans-2-enoyl-CoA reductase (NAD+)